MRIEAVHNYFFKDIEEVYRGILLGYPVDPGQLPTRRKDGLWKLFLGFPHGKCIKSRCREL